MIDTYGGGGREKENMSLFLCKWLRERTAGLKWDAEE